MNEGDKAGTPDRLGVIKPNRIRINGVECVTPENAPVRVDGLLDKSQPPTATMTLFVRSLEVHGDSAAAADGDSFVEIHCPDISDRALAFHRISEPQVGVPANVRIDVDPDFLKRLGALAD